jgi:hypothetical protein
MRQAACLYAQQNGFFEGAGGNLDACTAANDANGSILTVHYPPSTSAGQYAGDPTKVEVAITRAHRTFLAGIIGLPVINVSTNAVAAYDLGMSNTSSLLALDNTSQCGTGVTHGTGDISIFPVVPGTDGGYVQVNSSCGWTASPDHLCPTSGQGALRIDGSGTITAPHVYVHGGCKRSGDLNGPLTEGHVQVGDPLEGLPEPDLGTPNPGAECGVGSGNFTTPTGSGAGGCRFNSAGTVNLQPGVYYGGWEIRNNVEIVLAPGIYVMAGGGIRLNAGGSITSVQGGGGTPAPVLIFNTDNPVTGTGQDDVDLNAQGTLRLRPIASGPYKGILVWNDGSEDASNPEAEIHLGGQASLDIAGTIYNPKGLVRLEGGSGLGGTAAVQIIAWQWDVGGNAQLNMPYDPNQLYQFPTQGLVR